LSESAQRRKADHRRRLRAFSDPIEWRRWDCGRRGPDQRGGGGQGRGPEGNARIQSGGELILFSGGTLSGLTISRGGTLTLRAGATISGMTASMGATLIVSNGATASAVRVMKG